jgi:hypothetical protein
MKRGNQREHGVLRSEQQAHLLTSANEVKLNYSMQYNLSLASAMMDTPQKFFDGVGWRFLDFWGGGY